MATRELNELMSFGHVVRSDGEGNVTDDFSPKPLANEVVYQVLDADGQSPDDEVEDLYSGWTLLNGFTGQHGYRGAFMHSSEYIGGALEDHIKAHAGYYVAVVVDAMPQGDEESENEEPENIGWAVAFKELDAP